MLAMFSGQNLCAAFVLPLFAFGFDSAAVAPAESSIGCRIRRRPFINLPAAHHPSNQAALTIYSHYFLFLTTFLQLLQASAENI